MKTIALVVILALPQMLVDPRPAGAEEGAFTLVTVCTEQGASEPGATKAEIYIPERLCCDGHSGLMSGLRDRQTGYYALDLTGIGKGKPLEPVHLQMSPGRDGVLVTQYTRGLSATFIPLNGGTVSFDERFAVDLNCTALFDTSKLE